MVLVTAVYSIGRGYEEVINHPLGIDIFCLFIYVQIVTEFLSLGSRHFFRMRAFEHGGQAIRLPFGVSVIPRKGETPIERVGGGPETTNEPLTRIRIL